MVNISPAYNRIWLTRFASPAPLPYCPSPQPEKEGDCGMWSQPSPTPSINSGGGQWAPVRARDEWRRGDVGQRKGVEMVAVQLVLVDSQWVGSCPHRMESGLFYSPGTHDTQQTVKPHRNPKKTSTLKSSISLGLFYWEVQYFSGFILDQV